SIRRSVEARRPPRPPLSVRDRTPVALRSTRACPRTDASGMGTDPYLAVVAELDLLARRVDALSGELRRLRGADAVGAAGTEGIPAAPPRPAPVPWAPAAQPARGRPGPWGVGGRAQAPADHGGGPRAPRRPRMSGARVLAWTGGGVTLFGVVLFLALAASRGWFGPVGRVACGAVLGAALIGVALRLQPRANARLGALALAGTGVATLYLTVAAAAAVYGFLAPAPALAPALAVAGGWRRARRPLAGAVARVRCGGRRRDAGARPRVGLTAGRARAGAAARGAARGAAALLVGPRARGGGRPRALRRGRRRARRRGRPRACGRRGARCVGRRARHRAARGAAAAGPPGRGAGGRGAGARPRDRGRGGAGGAARPGRRPPPSPSPPSPPAR